MYLPRLFQEQDPERLLAFMRRHSFATLVTMEDDVPFATHLPFLVEPGAAGPGGRLLAHMARANPQWRAFSQDRDVLVVFQGPHTYVSPSWYVTEPNVPTWNYAVVHAYGRPRVIEEPEECLRILRESVATYESGFEKPWSLEQVGDYAQRLLPGIAAFELRLSRVEGKFKLNQNRAPEDRRAVMSLLERSEEPEQRAVGALMRERDT
ncbi:FMN-binding negative transcriptional regulator [Hyalangium sp.]|uniref:FMN-binding negative transcriptional regulator n=1 Tax=Hyalangium sp. TaxID=2028555 RepID=UPI002D703707|nr:FMN-binding negative transcriptional regulator [Hyalangium sp.]HYH97576.1 FMN-binding negative transcriptional regulator [Hyalangium sp.]